MKPQERLDVMLVRRGLAESREQARRLILAGEVHVAGERVTTPARRIAPDAVIERLRGPRFVSRGGEKLEAALNAFGLEVRGRVCLDVGASTGGFTDCLLQRGARRVIAVDVGRGQLHWRLRNDPRVIVLEGINARYLTAQQLPEHPDLVTVDVSFISLTKVLPALIALVPAGGDVVTLVKPQFEAGRREVGKGGVVRDETVRRRVLESLRRSGEAMGLRWIGVVESPLRGPAGNVEYFVHWKAGPVTRLCSCGSGGPEPTASL